VRESRCIVHVMKALAFGVLGAVAAAVYWRYTASIDPLFQLAATSTVVVDGLIYAAAGFVVGWALGFAASKIGGDGL
jgi:hypothetical protein